MKVIKAAFLLSITTDAAVDIYNADKLLLNNDKDRSLSSPYFDYEIEEENLSFASTEYFEDEEVTEYDSTGYIIGSNPLIDHEERDDLDNILELEEDNYYLEKNIELEEDDYYVEPIEEYTNNDLEEYDSAGYRIGSNPLINYNDDEKDDLDKILEWEEDDYDVEPNINMMSEVTSDYFNNNNELNAPTVDMVEEEYTNNNFEEYNRAGYRIGSNSLIDYDEDDYDYDVKLTMDMMSRNDNTIDVEIFNEDDDEEEDEFKEFMLDDGEYDDDDNDIVEESEFFLLEEEEERNQHLNEEDDEFVGAFGLYDADYANSIQDTENIMMMTPRSQNNDVERDDLDKYILDSENDDTEGSEFFSIDNEEEDLEEDDTEGSEFFFIDEGEEEERSPRSQNSNEIVGAFGGIGNFGSYGGDDNEYEGASYDKIEEENNGNDVEYDSAGYIVGSNPLIDDNDQMNDEEDVDDDDIELEFFILDSEEDDDDDSIEPGSNTMHKDNVQEVNYNNEEDVILHSHPDYDEEDVDDGDIELEFFILDSEEDDDDDSLEPGSNTVQEVNVQEVNDNNEEDDFLPSHPDYDEVMNFLENHMQILDDEKDETNQRVGGLLTDESVMSDSLDNADVIYNSETDNNSSDEEPISLSQSENTEFVSDDKKEVVVSSNIDNNFENNNSNKIENNDDDDPSYDDYSIGKELDLISDDINDYQEMKHKFSYNSILSQEEEEENDPTTMDMKIINDNNKIHQPTDYDEVMNSLEENSDKEYDDNYDLPQLGENTEDTFFTAVDKVAGDDEDDDEDDDNYNDTSLFNDDDGLMDAIIHRNKSNHSNQTSSSSLLSINNDITSRSGTNENDDTESEFVLTMVFLATTVLFSILLLVWIGLRSKGRKLRERKKKQQEGGDFQLSTGMAV